MSHKKQGLALSLTKEALEALFPTGTQAYVDLRQAVLQNFVDSHIKPRIETGVQNILNQMASDIKLEVTRQLQNTRRQVASNGSTAQLQFKAVIDNLVKQSFDQIIHTTITQSIDEKITLINQDISNKLAVQSANIDRIINLQVHKEISAKILLNIRQAVDKEQEKLNACTSKD